MILSTNRYFVKRQERARASHRRSYRHCTFHARAQNTSCKSSHFCYVQRMTRMYGQAAMLIFSFILLSALVLWSKWRERKKGYSSRFNWTTDTGKVRADKSQPYFTKKARWKMKEWGLSEKQVIDVLYHGSTVEQHKMVRTYNKYEIGLYYGRDKRDGHYIIFSCWKQNRR